MEFDKKEEKFFADDARIRHKLGTYGWIAKPMYRELISAYPAERERLFDSLQHTFVKLDNIDNSDDMGTSSQTRAYTGRTYDLDMKVVNNIVMQSKHFDQDFNLVDYTDEEKQRAFEYLLSMDNGVNLDKFKPTAEQLDERNIFTKYAGEYLQNEHNYLIDREIPEDILAEMDKVGGRQSFIHEMLHAYAKEDMFKYDLGNYAEYPNKDLWAHDLRYLERVGSMFQTYFAWDDEHCSFAYQSNMYQKYKEESIVDEWSCDMAEKFGFFDKLNFDYHCNYEYPYVMLTAVGGIFDVIGNGEWRNELLTGKRGEKLDLAELEKMETVYFDFVSALLANEHIDDPKFEDVIAPQLASAWIRLLDYCDNRFNELLDLDLLTQEQIYRYNDLASFLANQNNLSFTLGLFYDVYDPQNKPIIEEIQNSVNEVILKYNKSGLTEIPDPKTYQTASQRAETENAIKNIPFTCTLNVKKEENKTFLKKLSQIAQENAQKLHTAINSGVEKVKNKTENIKNKAENLKDKITSATDKLHELTK